MSVLRSILLGSLLMTLLQATVLVAGGAGQTVVLDYYHNNEWRKNASGTPERYHYVWGDTTNSGFSQFGKILTGLGLQIDSLATEPTEEALRDAAAYIIVDPDTPQETSSPHYIEEREIRLLTDWVSRGGVLVLFGNDSANAEFTHLNRLAKHFGITFNEDRRNRVIGKDYTTGTFSSFPPHPLFSGVRKLFLKEISTLSVVDPAGAVLTDAGKVIMAFAPFGKGKVFAVGDPWFYNEYMDQRRLTPEYDNSLAAKNLFRWLLDIREEPESLYQNVPFDMPKLREPQFPGFTVRITDFGAVADGKTINTMAFARAIDACAKAGGGTVVVPPGNWLTGPITMKSFVRLHVEHGALVQFSRNLEEYPLVAEGRRYFRASPINALNQSNIAVTGPGIFDGNGEAWRYVKRSKVTAREWQDLLASGGAVTSDSAEWWPSAQARDGAAFLKKLDSSGTPATSDDYASVREYLRPDLVRFVGCKNILFDGPTFRNSPRYHVHPIQCENIIIRNIFVQCPWNAQNGDGIDLSACRNVVVYRSTLDVGDDGICVKPSRQATDPPGKPTCENIIIEDCTVYRAHGGFVVGSESIGGAHNILVRNCTFIGTDVGIRFKSYRGNGGLVDRIFIEGIRMHQIINDGILFDMYYSGNSPDIESTKNRSHREVVALSGRTPQFRDIHVKDVVCTGADRAILVNGLPELTIRNIEFERVLIQSRRGVFCQDADSISFSNCSVTSTSGPAIEINECRDIRFVNGSYSSTGSPLVSIGGAGSARINLRNVNPPELRTKCEISGGADAKAIRWEATY